MLSTTLGLLALTSTAFAHPGRDWQQQAQIKDATQECTYYDFEPLQQLVSQLCRLAPAKTELSEGRR